MIGITWSRPASESRRTRVEFPIQFIPTSLATNRTVYASSVDQDCPVRFSSDVFGPRVLNQMRLGGLIASTEGSNCVNHGGKKPSRPRVINSYLSAVKYTVRQWWAILN